MHCKIFLSLFILLYSIPEKTCHTYVASYDDINQLLVLYSTYCVLSEVEMNKLFILCDFIALEINKRYLKYVLYAVGCYTNVSESKNLLPVN